MLNISKDIEPGATNTLHLFHDQYMGYHGYVSVFVCIFGVITSVFNIIVLTRKTLRNTTNYILTALAISDLLTMASYIPFALHFYILNGPFPNPRRNTLRWIYFFYFHVHFTVFTHTTSIWLGVVLGIFRYAFVKVGQRGSSMFATKQTIIAIAGVYMGSLIILIPNYLSLTIISGRDHKTNTTLYNVASISTSTSYGKLVNSVNFWVHALLVKLVPCMLLTIFGVLLLLTLHMSVKRHVRLRSNAAVSYHPGGIPEGGCTSTRRRSNCTLHVLHSAKMAKSREKDNNRTTIMLIIVVILFLMTELPQGILALCSGLRPSFFEDYYMPLGDLMDIIALINNAINFILYCCMSKQFRDTFLGLFCWPFLSPDKRVYLNGTSNADYSLKAAARSMLLEQKSLMLKPIISSMNEDTSQCSSEVQRTSRSLGLI